jgi:hypothetical protein
MKTNKYYTVGTLAGRVFGITFIRYMYVHNQQIGKVNNLRWYPTPDPKQSTYIVLILLYQSPKTTAKLAAKSCNKHRSNRVQWRHL